MELSYEQILKYAKECKWWVAGAIAVFIFVGAIWFLPGVRAYAMNGLAAALPMNAEAEREQAEREKKLGEKMKSLQDAVIALEANSQKNNEGLTMATARTGEVETSIRDVLQEMSNTDALLAKQYKELQASIRRVNQNVALANSIQLPDIIENTTPSDESPVPTQPGKINLNMATAAQLDELPGIGLTYANRIIEYREKNGNFKTLEGVMEVSGIGESLFAKIKDLITL
ncbi:MAG: hypothetical protein K0S20_139 [Patescibacteria group bacterium]|jgi:comEA protein|nr:hypothetical protein [Patescibacteria group bacterium]